MGAIALVLLIWFSFNVALVVIRWLHLDRFDDVPQVAPDPAPTNHTGVNAPGLQSFKIDEGVRQLTPPAGH